MEKNKRDGKSIRKVSIMPNSCGRTFNVSKRQGIKREGVLTGIVYYIIIKVFSCHKKNVQEWYSVIFIVIIRKNFFFHFNFNLFLLWSCVDVN